MKRIILYTSTLLLLFTSCLKEGEVELSLKRGSREVEMLFTGSFGSGSSLNLSDTEIAELDLMVCKDGKYQYMRPGYSKEDRFHATLKVEENVDIYFFANAREALENLNPLEGTPFEDIRQSLIITSAVTNTAANTAALPMWGQLLGTTISEHTVNNLGEVTLLRAVALANVYFELDGEDKGLPFTPEEAYLYFAADKGLIAPSGDNLTFGTAGRLTGVHAPEAPYDMQTNQRISATVEANAFTGCFYMFDNPTREGNQSNGRKRTRIVVGGKLDGSDELTYYPLDFFETGREELLPATRNQKYNITITSVNGEGWPTPDIAAEKAPVNINYQVIPWNENDHEDIAVDGPHYLSVSKRSVTLYRKAGAKTYIRLAGTYLKEDFTLTFKNSLNGNVQTIADGIRNDRFQVQLTGTGTDLSLTVLALKDYSRESPQLNHETLQIVAGRIRFTIAIEQITSGDWDDGGDQEIDL